MIWRDDNPSDRQVTLDIVNLGTGESISYASSGTSVRGTESKYIYFYPNVPAGTTKTYQFRFANSAGSGSTPRVHIYIISARGAFTNGDNHYQVTVPAVADSAVAVGNWRHRNHYTSMTGSTHWLSGSEDILDPMSSRGPRIDDVVKPDIVTPGDYLLTTRDTTRDTNPFSRVDNDGVDVDSSGPGDYYATGGTSLASPVAAGAAALLLEAFPWLSPAQSRSLLTSTASNGGATDSDTGYGMVDILAAIQAAGDLDTPTPTLTSTPTETPSIIDTDA